MTSISLRDVVKEYVAGDRVIDSIDLTIEDGEFFVLVGPSGCGKSTLLRLVAGLEHLTSGVIEMGDRDVSRLSPSDRDIAMVFQNYAIYPHMTVRRNIGYGLRVRGTAKGEVGQRVEEVARMLGLEELLDRRPSTLSGGQLQRVAMGRAIARRPQIYLMDEPLSNLDAKLRVSMRAELDRLHQTLGVTTLYVTHDQVEAMTLGQRAAVLRDGVVQQVGTPQVLYASPANAFVAAFIGSPPMNFAVGRLGSGGTIEFGGFSVDLPAASRPPLRDDETLLVGVRPEDFLDPRYAPPSSPTVQIECKVVQDLGHEKLAFFSARSSAADTAAIRRVTYEDDRGDHVVADEDGRLFCARLGADFAGAAGETVTLALAAEALTFFDLSGGENLGSSEPAGGSSPRTPYPLTEPAEKGAK